MRPLLPRICTLALALVALPHANSQPTVFRCVDGAGRVAYQSAACGEGGKQIEVKLPPVPPSAPASARASLWKGYVPPKVAAITFYYDPAEEPVGYSTAQMEGVIRAAIAAWGGCQVRLVYGGRAPAKLPGTPERVPIRWAPEYLGKAHPSDSRSGLAGTGSMHHGISLTPRFHEANMLAVVVHEMGHVFGLPHFHEEPDSIMSYLKDETRRRGAQPTQKDVAACNLSISKTFGSDIGVASRDSLPQDPQMTDREAAQKLRARRERESERELSAPLKRGSQQ